MLRERNRGIQQGYRAETRRSGNPQQLWSGAGESQEVPRSRSGTQEGRRPGPVDGLSKVLQSGRAAEQYRSVGPASKAFKAAIDSAPDNPKNAESYYQYGLSLAAQATVDKDGKFVAPPGTIESFQKYLALTPEGPNAQPCKDMITQLGGSIQTTYKNPNAKGKDKKQTKATKQ
jgi:hypothetical protein